MLKVLPLCGVRKATGIEIKLQRMSQEWYNWKPWSRRHVLEGVQLNELVD